MFLSDSGIVYTDGTSFKLIDEDIWYYLSRNSDEDRTDSYLVWFAPLRLLFLYDSATSELYVKSYDEWTRWTPAASRIFQVTPTTPRVVLVDDTLGFLNVGLPGTSALDTYASTTPVIPCVYSTGWQGSAQKRLLRSVMISLKAEVPRCHINYEVYFDLNEDDIVMTGSQMSANSAADLSGSPRKFRIDVIPDGTFIFVADDLTIGFIPAGGI